MPSQAEKKRRRLRQGAFGEYRFPGAEDDLSMATMVRYRTTEDVHSIARFFMEIYEEFEPHIQMRLTEDEGLPVFAAAVGPHYKGPGQFGAIVVMTDKRSRNKRKPIQHIIVTSRSGYDD